MNTITIDASVVLKWVSSKDEADLSLAKEIFTSAVKQQILPVSPTLMKAEVGNILLKKKKLSKNEVLKALETIKEANITYVELSDSLINEAVGQAHKHNLNVYDGIYLATARLSNSVLISADEKGHGKLKEVILLKDLNLQEL